MENNAKLIYLLDLKEPYRSAIDEIVKVEYNMFYKISFLHLEPDYYYPLRFIEYNAALKELSFTEDDTIILGYSR